MTGSELIARICESVEDFDMEIAIEILNRDNDGCVINKQRINSARFIDGKLGLEGRSVSECSRFD